MLPDSKFYSVKGRYIDSVFQGYGTGFIPEDIIPSDRIGRDIFIDLLRTERGKLPSGKTESNTYSYMIGALYYALGCATIWARLLNIFISMFSVYLLFSVAKKHFGDLAANLFLVIALLLPAQFGYSITLSRDFLRVLTISVIIWVAYNIGDLWKIRSGT